MKFILICATGRSGSTTMQRIVNTIPGANICGENNNAIVNLLEFYENVKNTNINYRPYNLISLNFEEREKTRTKPCWYNSFDMDQIKEHVRKIIIDFLDNTGQYRVIGFKEIRWLNKLHHIQTFIELFPDTKIIYHIKKDVETQSKSAWHAYNKNSKTIIDQQNRLFTDQYNRMKSQSYLSTFEDMFNEEKLSQLFEYLNEPYDREAVSRILADSFEAEKK